MAPLAAQALRMPLVQRWQAGPVSPLGHEPDADPPNRLSHFSPDLGPTAMTIGIVAESVARSGVAEVVACLAELAVADELIVVFGSGEHDAVTGVRPLVTGLRELLPRHTVVVLHLSSRIGLRRREAALLDELLELGSLPIVVTQAETEHTVSAQLCDHLQADRVLRASHAPAGGTHLQELWYRDTTAAEPVCARRAA